MLLALMHEAFMVGGVSVGAVALASWRLATRLTAIDSRLDRLERCVDPRKKGAF